MRKSLLLALAAGFAVVSTFAAEAKTDRATDGVVVAVATTKKANAAAPTTKATTAPTTNPVAASTYQLERDSCCIGN